MTYGEAMGTFLDKLERYRVVIGSIVAILMFVVGGLLVWIDWHPPRTTTLSTKTVVKKDVAANPVQNVIEASTVAAPSAAQIAKTGVVNINTASATELDTLPGIGTTYAARIVAYRQAHGLFKNVHDIVNVSGIGEGIFAKIAGLITIGGN